MGKNGLNVLFMDAVERHAANFRSRLSLADKYEILPVSCENHIPNWELSRLSRNVLDPTLCTIISQLYTDRWQAIRAVRIASVAKIVPACDIVSSLIIGSSVVVTWKWWWVNVAPRQTKSQRNFVWREKNRPTKGLKQKRIRWAQKTGPKSPRN